MKTKIIGWIKSIRQSKDILFLAITDGARDHQLTIKPDCVLVGELKVGASVAGEGTPGTTPRGFAEIVMDTLTVIGRSDDDYPIQPKHHGFDFLRTVPELRGRVKSMQAALKMRHYVTQAIHRYLETEGYFQYYTPIITHADCEGAGETFEIKSEWMSEQLTVSGQLHAEVGMMALGKVYTFSPCFRAEKSATKKHLAEFWMIEPEAAFLDLSGAMDLAEGLVKYVLGQMLAKCQYEFTQLGFGIDHISAVMGEWPRIEYGAICKEFGVTYGQDISSPVEALITAKYGPTFITHYPEKLKPFYMKKSGGVAMCFDLLFPEVGELIGGSEREESFPALLMEMEHSGLDMAKMKWYLDTRRWGSVPHAGFGLGLERLLMFITKMPKVHDVIPFPVSF